MSETAFLVCDDRRTALLLGKPLKSSGVTTSYAFGGDLSPPNSQDAELTRALWKFLADTAGATLRVGSSYDDDFETVAQYRIIGGEEPDGNISLESYVDGFDG